tara:strand:+ start:2658 stop:2915 length:258 start_codon:yes stop_codon:yes gene_type:complete
MKKDIITNQNKYSDQVEELVQEIEYKVSSLIRKMILNSHTENSDGLKFKPDGNGLDYAISQYVLHNGLNNSIEQVLNDQDDQNSY